VSAISERSARHKSEIERLERERTRTDQRANRISLFRLVTFLGAVISISVALSQGQPALLLLFFALLLAFFVGVVWHARTLARIHELGVRRGVHERQLMRINGVWHGLTAGQKTGLPPEHPYASDIDLTGPGSLLQRIDVSQTREGELALLGALGERSDPDTIRKRQAAVEELFERTAFREDIEALGLIHQERGEKIDHRPFMGLFGRPFLFDQKRWLFPAIIAMVTVTLTVSLLAALELVPSPFVWLCAFAQMGVLWATKQPVHQALDAITARLGFAKAYEGIFQRIEAERFRSPCLLELQAELTTGGRSAATHLKRLSRCEGFAQLRTQGPFYLVLNVLTLWDLFCLERIERFAKDVGPACEAWFFAVGKLELLCSLATLRHVDPHASYPKLVAPGGPLNALGLGHPLLPAHARVLNDVDLDGPASVLIVTGSNMAGKSTLLRALGLNVALALAGGPVCATQMTLPLVRLRASMRIDDSLQRGASYFHAELSRLRTVVAQLDRGEPVLFLLDELLRGTNAHARQKGARAVILHLLKYGAMGVVATHDIGLSELADDLPGKARNVHFTDVFVEGEMRFDYTLREGVVKTSNALRLLSMAGIDVEVDDALR
jgi:Flp pilus assembly protein TadB